MPKELFVVLDVCSREMLIASGSHSKKFKMCVIPKYLRNFKHKFTYGINDFNEDRHQT